MQEHQLLSSTQIHDCVMNMAAQIGLLPRDQQPNVVVPILTGGLIFGADILRALAQYQVEASVGFLKMQRVLSPAYHKPTILRQSDLTWLVPGGLEDKRILLVDGIFDTGATLFEVTKFLHSKNVQHIKVAVMVWRNDPNVTIRPDYFGYDMQGQPHYIYGYGMDVEQTRRGLPDIRFKADLAPG